jgi:hypothetical protein
MMLHNGLGGGFGFFGLLLYIVLIVIPVAKILGRLGFSQWWAAVAAIPLVNLVFLWIVAFIEWPRDRAAS